MPYELVAEDGGSKVAFTVVRRDNGGALDLTGKSVHFEYRIDGGTLQSRAMTVTSAAEGKAEYQFVPTDLPTPGTLVGQVVVQRLQADQLTSLDTIKVPIRARL